MRLPERGPGLPHEFTPQQELACALRICAREGWRENMSGHITVATDDGGMWCNPWGLWWDEVTASDIVRLDADGNIVEGKWDVTPLVFMHTELHRTRPDARVIVHNHPYYATLLALMKESPRLAQQNSAIFDGDIAFVDEYASAETTDAAKSLAVGVGDATGILLAHHGAIVIAPNVMEACYKAEAFERMCRFTYDALAAGRELEEMPAEDRAGMKVVLHENVPLAYWDGAVRTLLREQPEVLA